MVRPLLQHLCFVALLFNRATAYQPASLLFCPARSSLHGRLRYASIAPCYRAIRSSPLLMMEDSPPPAPQDSYVDSTSPKSDKPRINWTDRFKKALDMNPGRSERLGRNEQESRYKQVLTANPNDVDALCGYACFLSTVKEDYAGAAELYSTAIKTDPARARRITVQLWADLWAMRAENARATKAKDKWRQLLEKLDKEGRGVVSEDDVRAVFLRRGMPVPEEAIAQAKRGGVIYYLELAEALVYVPPPSFANTLLDTIMGR